MTPPALDEWTAQQLGITVDDVEQMMLMRAFEVFIARLEEARERGAKDPFVTVSSKGSGGNSRACTKRMLDRLGFSPAERRAVHRLIAGSSDRWPGLLRLYANAGQPTSLQRQYARRQLLILRRRKAA
jgi:hypothetical protein